MLKYKEEIERVILEAKLSSAAEVLGKERKIFSIKDCAVNSSLLCFWCMAEEVQKGSSWRSSQIYTKINFHGNGINL